MKKILPVIVLVCYSALLNAQHIRSAEYYFNTDPGYGNGMPLTVTNPDSVIMISSSIPTEGLASGMHTLFVRACTDQGIWSLPESRLVFIARLTQYAPDEISGAEYFIDRDNGEGKNTAVVEDLSDTTREVSIVIPVPDLTEGFHQLYFRVRNRLGQWSVVEQKHFYVSRAMAAPVIAAEYFFNTDPGLDNGIALPVAQGDSVQIISEIAIPLTDPGIHHLYLRTQDASGNWSLAESRQLFIIPRLNDGPIVAAEYFFDTDPGYGQGQNIMATAGDEVQLVAEINTAQLSNGFHHLYVRTKNADGIWSLVEGQMFYVSKALADILRAEYYFNDQDPGIGKAQPLLINSAAEHANYNIALPKDLLPGEHQLTLRVQQGNLEWSFSETQRFTIEALHSLPVHLLSFKGWLKQHTVTLQWLIGPEIRAKEFIIERAVDGRNFYPIATINVNNAVPVYSFDFTDNGLTGGEYFYRLKHTGEDDKTGYSGVLYFKAEKKVQMRLYPNPAAHSVHIELPDSGKPAMITVISQQGQVVLKHSALGRGVETINISRLPAGAYQLLVEQDGKRFVESFLKKAY